MDGEIKTAICIQSHSEGLTVGKAYAVKEDIYDSDYYEVQVDDFGHTSGFLKVFFEEKNVMGEINPKDYPEDFTHENGNYQNECMKCEGLFFGHKRRVICKECLLDNDGLFTIFTPEEDKSYRIEFTFDNLTREQYDKTVNFLKEIKASCK